MRVFLVFLLDYPDRTLSAICLSETKAYEHVDQMFPYVCWQKAENGLVGRDSHAEHSDPKVHIMPVEMSDALTKRFVGAMQAFVDL